MLRRCNSVPVPRAATGRLHETLDCRDPTVGFRLADPFCMNGGVPLTKVQSAPGPLGDPRRASKRPLDGEAPSSPAWRCRGPNCKNMRRDTLELNDEAQFVCPSCGTVDAQKMVAMDRQKNCAREDDATVVADRPRSSVVSLEGMTSTSVLRDAHLEASAGTRMDGRKAWSQGFGAANSKLDAEAARNAMEDSQMSSLEQKKLCAIMRTIESAFDAIQPPALHARVQEYVRMEAAKLLRNGFRHAKCCPEVACQVNIATRSNGLIGVCATQAVLARLARPAKDEGASLLSRVAPDTTSQAVEQAITRLQQRCRKNGSTHHAQVAAAVEIALDWTEATVMVPCGTVHPTVAPIVLPTAVQIYSESSMDSLDGMSTPQEDEGSILVFEVRDKIMAVCRLVGVSEEVRSVAFDTISNSSIVDWIKNSNNLPTDVLGAVILSAAAVKLEQLDCTERLLARVCTENSISKTTASQVRDLLIGMMTDGALENESVADDGIF